MLAANIEDTVKKIIEKNGKAGWMRANECSKKYAQKNPSLETKFYRWLKQVDKKKVKGFQSLKLPNNISFIGLESADPRAIESFISEDKKINRSIKAGFGFFEWLKWKRQNEDERLDHNVKLLHCRREIMHRLMEENAEETRKWKIISEYAKRFELDEGEVASGIEW